MRLRYTFASLVHSLPAIFFVKHSMALRLDMSPLSIFHRPLIPKSAPRVAPLRHMTGLSDEGRYLFECTAGGSSSFSRGALLVIASSELEVQRIIAAVQ